MVISMHTRKHKPDEAPPSKPARPAVQLVAAERSAEPDMIDRLFEYVLAELPDIPGQRLQALKAAVRAEFAGEKQWIAKRPPTERQRLIAEVFALFDGRNATEVARRLGIGRTTVYRILKQPGKT